MSSKDNTKGVTAATESSSADRGTNQFVAGIEIFDDEHLHHDIKPSFFGALSRNDIVFTVITAGFWLVVPFFKWRNTRYVITSKRLIDKQGSLTGTTTEEIRFDDIVGDIRTSQGLIEGILNKGTIEFEIEKQRGTTASRRETTERESSRREMEIERREIELNGIKNHQEVNNTIRRIAHS